MFKKILLPVNPLKEEGGLIQAAIDLAKELNAKVHIITFALENDGKKIVELRRKAMEKYAKNCQKQGVTVTHELVRAKYKHDEVPQEIAKRAKKYDAVIVGHCKFSKIYRFVHQSTAQDLINMAPCPVIVVTIGAFSKYEH
ncbi:MAG: universal stress protein [Methanocellales archaeon]|nr:universal stress protein [Methanocellales archaeon]